MNDVFMNEREQKEVLIEAYRHRGEVIDGLLEELSELRKANEDLVAFINSRAVNDD